MYAARSGNPGETMSDWTTDAADLIDATVARVRDRTVEPAYAITKGIVYGLVAALVLLPALILAFIGLFRVLVIVEQGYVWAAWCTMGGIFVIGGAFCWAKRP